MSQSTVIDYDVNKWKKRLNDDTISLDEVRNTYKMFHTKDLGTKHLDFNIRLSFKAKFNKLRFELGSTQAEAVRLQFY